MSLATILKKIDSLKIAIECLEVLITEYDDIHLKPTLNYLKEQKLTTSKEIATRTYEIEVQAEQISRLSHI
jgi:hypothetical protein